MQHQVLEIHGSIILGASEHCCQRSPEIRREMNLSRTLNRLTNVLESGDNHVLQPNTTWTKTLYDFEQCDDEAKVEHARHNHPKRH